MSGKIYHSGMSPEKALGNIRAAEPKQPEIVNLEGPRQDLVEEEMQRAELDSLFMLGYVEGVETIDNFTFKMRTLTNEENQKVTLLLGKTQDNTQNVLSAQDMILAHSIVSVNNNSLESFCDEDGDVLDRRMKVIKKLQGNIVNKLIMFYNKLSSKSTKPVVEEDLKK